MGLSGKHLGTVVDLLRSKRVLVTGNTGFMGSWLSAWLISSGARVTGYSLNPPTDPSMFDVIGLKSRMTCELGDINDLEHLKNAMQHSRAEVVFHLAAQPLVRRSYLEPILTFDTNIVGTAKVLRLFGERPRSKPVSVSLATSVMKTGNGFTGTERMIQWEARTPIALARGPRSS